MSQSKKEKAGSQLVIDSKEYYNIDGVREVAAARLAFGIAILFSVFVFVCIGVSIFDSSNKDSFEPFYNMIDKILPILSAILGSAGTYYFVKK